MLLCEPQRGRRSRRSEHHLDAGLAKKVQGPAHPIEIELPFLWFVNAPGELAHADHVYPGLEHQLYVALPARFRSFSRTGVGIDPMLGIIINAEIHRPSLGSTLGRAKQAQQRKRAGRQRRSYSRSIRPQSSGRPITPARGAQAMRDLLIFSPTAASFLS